MSEVMNAAVRGIGAALSGLLELARVVRTTATAARHVSAQVVGVQGDDSTEVWQPYGFQARPKADAVAVQAAIGGHQESLVTLMVHDRRYNIALQEGEVALVDDLGQKVHLTRNGIVVVADIVTVQSSDVRLGAGPTYRQPVCVGDVITGLTSPSGAVTGTIGSVSPGASDVRVS